MRIRKLLHTADPELLRARDVRADIAFGERILDIADAENTSDDWVYNAKTGKLTVSKEAGYGSRCGNGRCSAVTR
jgi:hypothetical protein